MAAEFQQDLINQAATDREAEEEADRRAAFAVLPQTYRGPGVLQPIYNNNNADWVDAIIRLPPNIGIVFIQRQSVALYNKQPLKKGAILRVHLIKRPFEEVDHQLRNDTRPNVEVPRYYMQSAVRQRGDQNWHSPVAHLKQPGRRLAGGAATLLRSVAR